MAEYERRIPIINDFDSIRMRLEEIRAERLRPAEPETPNYAGIGLCACGGKLATECDCCG